MTATRPPLFDARAARLRRARARVIGGERFLTQGAVEGLGDRLGAVTRRFAHALIVGGPVPEKLAPLAEDWTEADFESGEALGETRGGFDLAVSVFSLQMINDLPGALIQIRRALKPDGLFVCALLGGATLHELRQSFAHAESETLGGISPRVSPFADVREMGALLQRAGFALPVADVERSLVRYRDFSALVRDLRAEGWTNMLSERRKLFLPRRTLAALLAYYAAHHAADGKLKATFETIYLTGWAPHDSQQQPLRPGSASTRLSAALGVEEHATGENATPGETAVSAAPWTPC